MGKTTKYAQRITIEKVWWHKLFFWKKWYQPIKGIEIKSSPVPLEPLNVKLYRQKDQSAKTIDHIENECDFICNLPSIKSVAVEEGAKYWVVIPAPETAKQKPKKPRKLKLPTDPIIISEKDAEWLDKMLKDNEVERASMMPTEYGENPDRSFLSIRADK